MDRRTVLLVLVSLGACGPVAAGSEGTGDASSTTGGAAPTTGVVVGTTSVLGGSEGTGTTGGSSESTAAGVESSVSGVDDGTFIIPPDGGVAAECEVLTQDCPDGQKCMPYADDGGSSWNNTKCVPIMGNPVQAGETCFAEGNGVSGIDNCELGSMCWDVDAQGEGYCIAMCKGTYEEPYCESPTETCAIYGGGYLAICIPRCDPLAQDCDPVDVCIPSDGGFICVLDASGEEGQVHDPCMYANSCDPGLMCLESTAAVECDPQMSGCCQPFCDLSEPNACTGQGQVCNAYFEEGAAPPGLENVGYCSLP